MKLFIVVAFLLCTAVLAAPQGNLPIVGDLLGNLPIVGDLLKNLPIVGNLVGQSGAGTTPGAALL